MKFSTEEIKKAAQALSERYRRGTPPYLRKPIDRYAYLTTRFPATQAVLYRVFQEIKHFSITSILDIGAGPGTSWDPACATWKSLTQATLIERDREFIEMGRASTPAEKVTWITSEASAIPLQPHDLVLFSYSWGEIADPAVLEKAWEATGQFLVVIEPGTPQGYQRMLQARKLCIQQGGKVYAPCPHSHQCPWENTAEWCHFSVRLERTPEHQLAKEGTLGYEDEKFSYVILSKGAVPALGSRLLKDPLKRKGHMLLTLCTEQGIKETIVTKKNKESYKKVKKMKWGDKIINQV